MIYVFVLNQTMEWHVVPYLKGARGFLKPYIRHFYTVFLKTGINAWRLDMVYKKLASLSFQINQTKFLNTNV